MTVGKGREPRGACETVEARGEKKREGGRGSLSEPGVLPRALQGRVSAVRLPEGDESRGSDEPELKSRRAASRSSSRKSSLQQARMTSREDEMKLKSLRYGPPSRTEGRSFQQAPRAERRKRPRGPKGGWWW